MHCAQAGQQKFSHQHQGKVTYKVWLVFFHTIPLIPFLMCFWVSTSIASKLWTVAFQYFSLSPKTPKLSKPQLHTWCRQESWFVNLHMLTRHKSKDIKELLLSYNYIICLMYHFFNYIIGLMYHFFLIFQLCSPQLCVSDLKEHLPSPCCHGTAAKPPKLLPSHGWSWSWAAPGICHSFHTGRSLFSCSSSSGSWTRWFCDCELSLPPCEQQSRDCCQHMGGKGRCRSETVPALEDECDCSQRQILGHWLSLTPSAATSLQSPSQGCQSQVNVAWLTISNKGSPTY